MSNKVAIYKRKNSLRRFASVMVFCAFFLVWAQEAYAHCVICHGRDCRQAVRLVINHHADAEDQMTTHITNRFEDYAEWLLNTYFIGNILPAMMMMTEQLSAVGMYQMQGAGMLMDAKIQMETQRVFQELQVEAIKDYHPSENFCYFGTNMRSLSASQGKSRYTKAAMNKMGMNRLTGVDGIASGGDDDMRARWEHFRTYYCQVYNNNWSPANPDVSGLQPACGASANSARANMDVDYGRVVDAPRTIDMDLTVAGDATDDQQNVISLMRNLYGHRPPKTSTGFLQRKAVQQHYYDLRAVTAKRNVAMNSFNSIVGMKTAGASGDAESRTNIETYMAAVLVNLGVSDPEELAEMIGQNPSYYAQLEVLAKRVYQDQSFYANLYDKPENVARTGVAIKAVELMVEREMFESRLRREMLLSSLLSAKLDKHVDRAQGTMQALVQKNR